jgi:Integrase core domain
VQARLVDRRWFGVLTVVDQFTREGVLLYADLSMSGAKVAEALEPIVRQRGKPQSITCDNGTEFASRALDVWTWRHQIQLAFITPGRPVENSYIESFNGRLRDEFLNVNLFFSLQDVRQQLKSWQRNYNLIRPHSALADQTPSEFAASWNRAHFALPIVNKTGTKARPGFPNGTLTRGLDPPSCLPWEINRRAKLSSRLSPLAGVTGLSYCSVRWADPSALGPSSQLENSTPFWSRFRVKVSKYRSHSGHWSAIRTKRRIPSLSSISS